MNKRTLLPLLLLAASCVSCAKGVEYELDSYRTTMQFHDNFRVMQLTDLHLGIQDSFYKRHACLTSFKGLDDLSSFLASEASKILKKEIKKEVYDFYIYDESLILSADEILAELGYSVLEK